MKSIDCIQGSPEWHAARCGKVTASRIADITRKTKSGPSASRNTYLGEIVAERLSGQTTEKFKSAAMEWGSEQEAKARTVYAFIRDCEPSSVGFVDHPSIEFSGASPDGLVGDDGLVEIKCPNSATHIATLLGAVIDPDYVKQMQWQMACTGRTWCDFVSFDPRMPGDMQIHIQRVQRDGAAIVAMETEVRSFLSEAAETIGKLTAIYQAAQAAE